MKKLHSDLACESSRISDGMIGGRASSRTIGGVKITDIRITKPDSSLKAGRYITLEGDPSGHALPALLRRALQQLLPPGGVILAAGLGNPDITRDSLGALVVRRLVPQRGAHYSLAAIETDVAARTGIETVSLVRAAAREIGVACVIAVDSLSCSSPQRLCSTVQLSTAGIIPGSGADITPGETPIKSNSPHSNGHTRTAEFDTPALNRRIPRKELSRRTVGVPVIALGVPTALSVEDITLNPAHRGLLAAPADEDVQIKLWSYAVADAVNSIIR